MYLHNIYCICIYIINWIHWQILYLYFVRLSRIWRQFQKYIKNDKEYDKSDPYYEFTMIGSTKLASDFNLNWNYISHNLSIAWNWYYISQCDFITWPIVRDNSHLLWNMEIICSRDFITPAIVNSNPKFPWCWGSNNSQGTNSYGLSANSNLTLDFVKSNITRPWNWIDLSSNCNVNINWIHELSKICYDINMVFDNSPYPYIMIPSDYYRSSKSIPWCWSRLTSNKGIKWIDIVSNLDLSWEWRWMHCRDDVTIKIIMQYKHLSWNWHLISYWTTLTWKIIVNNKEIPWTWAIISAHPNVTLDIIKNNPNAPWRWYYVSHNVNITWKDVISNLHLPWDYNGMSLNPNLKYQPFYYINLPWNWEKIGYNLYNDHPILKYRIELKKYKKITSLVAPYIPAVIIDIILSYIIEPCPTYQDVVNNQIWKKRKKQLYINY